jgi:hypothetical protein
VLFRSLPLCSYSIHGASERERRTGTGLLGRKVGPLAALRSWAVLRTVHNTCSRHSR